MIPLHRLAGVGDDSRAPSHERLSVRSWLTTVSCCWELQTRSPTPSVGTGRSPSTGVAHQRGVPTAAPRQRSTPELRRRGQLSPGSLNRDRGQLQPSLSTQVYCGPAAGRLASARAPNHAPQLIPQTAVPDESGTLLHPVSRWCTSAGTARRPPPPGAAATVRQPVELGSSAEAVPELESLLTDVVRSTMSACLASR